MTVSDRHRYVVSAALAVVGTLSVLGYRQLTGSDDGAWGLGSLLTGLIVIYLVVTWRTDDKSQLYRRGLLVGPGLSLALWGAGMLGKVHHAPEIVITVLLGGVVLTALGGITMLVVGERRRKRAA